VVNPGPVAYVRGRAMDQVGPIRRFIIDHDDKWLFTVFYIGAAVLLSIWISLFWLIVVVGVHFAFELVRCRHEAHPWDRALAESAWEIKLDMALVAFALALAVYMDVLLGVAGLQGAARVGANAGRAVRGGTRFVVWKRVLRGVLLSVDDAAQVGRAALRARRKKDARNPPTDEPDEPDDERENEAENEPGSDGLTTSPWRRRWGIADRLTIGFGIVCVVLVVVAPWLTAHGGAEVLSMLGEELHPWPG
jgi:hypothetical protein